MTDSFSNEIISLKKNIQTYFNEEFKEFNLKSSEIKLINILSKSNEESQVELAKKLDCDKAHIHRIVVKLLMKKIIFIASEKQEKTRNFKIKLTEHGLQIAEKINKKLEQWKLRLIKGINLKDIEIAKSVISQMSKNLNKEKNNA